jgi:hypothetical protein
MIRLTLILGLVIIAGCGEPVKPFAEAYVDYTTYHQEQYMRERDRGRAGINATEGAGGLYNFYISEAENIINKRNSVLEGGMGRLQSLQNSLVRATKLLDADTKQHKITIENHIAKLDALRKSLVASAEKEGRENEVPADDYTGYEKQLDQDIAVSKVKLAKLKVKFNETIKAANLVEEISLVD